MTGLEQREIRVLCTSYNVKKFQLYFAGLEFRDLTKKNMLKGTKFRENCQNTYLH